ncbi:MAG: hypothetical protein DRO36_03145 [Candidatus Hecatellales archaeon]|nr:MAG: hypothetical protein DRO36_03145 [Candidatus Hecatellales archaeon]
MKEEIGGMVKRTGVFYHETIGIYHDPLAMSVREGFEAIKREGLLEIPNIILFEAEAIPEGILLKTHTTKMVNQVKKTGHYEESLRSVGGTLRASEKILEGEIDNALVFIGDGGHHSYRDSFWGGCYFNHTAVTINYLREKLGVRRFAIVDTDTHHADGTRDFFRKDKDVLHICFCHTNHSDKEYNKFDIAVPYGISDEEYLKMVKREMPKVVEFKPELLYWVCGNDTHLDSYGLRSLTEKCYPNLTRIVKETAEKACEGRLVVKIGCNCPAYVSEYITPRIVDLLAETGKYKDY